MAVLLDSIKGALHRGNTGLVLGALLLAFLLTRAILSTRQWFRLRHIKGPPSAGFSKWWLYKKTTSGRAHLDFLEVGQKYGPMARISPVDVITNDPNLVKHFHNVRSGYRRSDWYNAMRFDPSKDNCLSTRSEARHNELRAKMINGYSGREIEGLEEKIDETILELIRLIETKYLDKPLDLARKVQYFTLDVISNIAYSQPFGFLTEDRDCYGYIKMMEDAVPMLMIAAVLPWTIDLLKSPIFKSLVPSEKDRLGFGKVIGIAKGKAAERFGPHRKVQKDMLGSFVAHGLTEEEAGSEILLQILAGSDTTSTAIRATMLHLITSPRALGRLHEEIAEAKPSWPVITDAEARKMPYLQAAVKEGLRIFPPVAGLVSKDVPKGGDTYKGVYLPEGTKISWSTWGVFRRPDIWGEDAAEFRPERWLDSEPAKLAEMESAMEVLFSWGRWQCLGKSVALMELNKIFVELVRRFEFVVVNPADPWKSICAGLFMQSEFWVRVYKREP